MSVSAKKNTTPFLCPSCKTPAPDFEVSQGIVAKFCSGCKGTWFGQGLLDSYLATDEDFPALERGSTIASTSACPACPLGKLEACAYVPDAASPSETAAKSPEVEKCSRCHGIWLSTGKLTALSGWAQHRKVERHAQEQRALKTTMRKWTKASRFGYEGTEAPPAAPDPALDQEIAELLARPRYGNIAPVNRKDLVESTELEVNELWSMHWGCRSRSSWHGGRSASAICSTSSCGLSRFPSMRWATRSACGRGAFARLPCPSVSLFTRSIAPLG